jgi:hypothetical protein
MRVMMKVQLPAEAGNRALKEGLLAKTVMGFVEKAKPEACYFMPEGGKRSMVFFFQLDDPTSIPACAEPFFTGLNAEVQMTPVMNLEELKKGLDKLGLHP